MAVVLPILFLSAKRDDVGSVAGIPKNRCRTTIAERMVETRAELPFTGDQIGLFSAQPGRPKRNQPIREKGTPQRIIAEGTDWRLLDELKRELKS